MNQRLENLSTKQLLSLIQSLSDRERREMAKNDYASYLSYILPESVYKHSAHTILMAKKLQEIADGTKKHARLIINVPIRHGKSETCVKRYLSYYLGKNPDNDVMVVSYGADLAEDFSRLARQDFREYGEKIFGLKLSAEKVNVARWEIAGHRGGCTAAGVGGPVFGRGASLILADDVFKNYEQAFSSTQRETVWNFYRNILRGRLTPDGSIVIVNVRLHPEDLCGKLIEASKHGGEQWEVISLPALSLGVGDPLGRPEGTPLWPERYPLKELLSIKGALGTVGWETQYMQNPSPLKGYYFKKSWLNYYEDSDVVFNEGNNTYYFQNEPIILTLASIDPAAKKEQHNDYTAVAVCSITRGKKILLRRMFNKKISIPDQLRFVVLINDLFHPNRFLVEEVQYQNSIREIILDQGDYVPFKIVKRGGRNSINKENRINLMSPFFESGKFYLHKDEEEFLAQYEIFPGTPNDDMLDALEMIFEEVRLLPSWGSFSLDGNQSFTSMYEEFLNIPSASYSRSNLPYNFEDSSIISPSSLYSPNSGVNLSIDSDGYFQF